MSLPPSSKVREFGRLEDNETREFLRILQWAKMNPTKNVDIFALTPDERDRIRAGLQSANGEAAVPSNILVSVKPEDSNTPIHVRTR